MDLSTMYSHPCTNKVEFLKIIGFLPFFTQIGQIFSLKSSRCGISSCIYLKFPLRFLYNHDILLTLKCIAMKNNLLKSLKIAIFRPKLHRSAWATPKTKNNSFCKCNKSIS